MPFDSSVLSLSDDELSAIMAAASPLQPFQRDAFLRDVASELQRYPEIGPGVVGRVCAKLQREHLNAPSRRPGPWQGGKYG